MKKFFYLVIILLFNSSLLFSQIAINTDGCAPDNSAILDVKSSNKGVLIPRMTVDQRNAISNPADGLMVFCTNCGVEGSLSIYSYGIWISLSPCSSISPTAGVNVITPGQIVWNWNAVAGAIGYKWNTTNYYSSATDMGTGCSKTETGIVGNMDYTRYVWSYNACSNSAPTTLTATTYAAAPATPTAGTQIPSWNQIIWNWNPVTDASGYKWNTTNNYASATDMGTYTTKTETGLTCGTFYTRYAWAYNGFGYSAPVSLTQTTLSCSTCGSSFTVNHVAGAVAPVTKTVTYGTVSNIPGETSHCWITSNLGADHQATAKNDATEASAGWYWQFNHRQGYKHDGTIRTPNTTWIINIDENTDWTNANDPCTIELGGSWRIPTASEWTNIDAAGNWISWSGPWNSALKIHAAGYLYNSDGSLLLRGNTGAYWSSIQGLPNSAQSLYLFSSSCSVGLYPKSMGYTLRCIKD